MRNFREEYSKTIQELPEFHMDADKVRNEGYQKRAELIRRRRWMVSAAAAAGVFVMCSVGVAAGIGFQNNRVETGQNGFSFWGMTKSNDSAQVAECAVEEVADEETVEEAVTDGEAADGEVWERTYDSIEEFRKQEDVVIAVPELAWLGEPDEVESQLVIVTEFMPIHIRVDFGEKCFMMSQDDNREAPEYASSIVFPGEAANQRSYTNEQGLTYQIFDSFEDGELIGTHAAISVNGRDVVYSFIGYQYEEVDAVLKQLDVSIYFREK